MPTKLRRITIALPPELDAAVLALAEATNTPHAKVVIDYLVELAPSMQAVAKIARQLKAGRTAEAKRTMGHAMGDQLAHMMQYALDMKQSKGGR